MASNTTKRKRTKKEKKDIAFGSRKILISFTLGITIFAIASLYTPWTGWFGRILSSMLFSFFGGAIIVPLVYSSYILTLKLFGFNIIKIIRQIIGVALIYINLSVLLGLFDMIQSSMFCRFIEPGFLGSFIANNLSTIFGPVGTFIVGTISIYLSMLILNVSFDFATIFPRNIWNPFKHILDFFKSNNNMNDTDVINKTETAIEEFQNINDNVMEETADNAIIEKQDPVINVVQEEPDSIAPGEFPPPIEVFGKEEFSNEIDTIEARPIGEKIIQTLEHFNIEATLSDILIGPTVIQFRIQLAPGIKVSRVETLSNDIALAMAVYSIRIEAPIPGTPYIGIEIPNPKRQGIPLRTVLESNAYKNTSVELPLPMGIGVNGESVIVGLEDLPHMLVAGTTGSGKSVFINACIVELCSTRTPSELRMILVDPKRVEMAMYDKLPHLLTPPVTDAKKAVHVLAWAIREMEQRYTTFAAAKTRNLSGFNKKVLPCDRLPHIVIVVDELADLMMTAPKEVEEYICRLAQMARATGIHLILATQRPSVNVITGLIKANIPARVAFTLPSNADSRTIIDASGAEKLLGKGDMLFLCTRLPRAIRIQSPWVSENVLLNWLDYMKNTFDSPTYIEINAPDTANNNSQGLDLDEDLLEPAIDVIMSTGIASASGLQRRLRIGFSRASRIIDTFEQLEIVGPADGAKAREILVDEEQAVALLKEARG